MTEPIPPLERGGRRAPIPVGPLTGRRTWWRRATAYAMATCNRTLDLLPGRDWIRGKLHSDTVYEHLDHELPPGQPGLDGLRFAFLSDLHAGSFMNARDLCRLAERVIEHEPHAVLLGGDLINTRDRELELLRDALRLLQPELGVFAVPGNHDHFWGRDIGRWQAFLEDHGVQVLRNRGLRIEREGSSMWLCGVDDLTEGRPDLAAALHGRRAGEATVLLSHHPDFFFEAAAAGVHLTLAGHTHGGQVRLFGRAPIHHSRFGYEQGWFRENGAALYVGRGVGVTFLPLRIDAPPEVPIVTLRSRARREREAADRAAAGAVDRR